MVWYSSIKFEGKFRKNDNYRIRMETYWKDKGRKISKVDVSLVRSEKKKRYENSVKVEWQLQDWSRNVLKGKGGNKLT